jgi:hypothetical protein
MYYLEVLSGRKAWVRLVVGVFSRRCCGATGRGLFGVAGPWEPAPLARTVGVVTEMACRLSERVAEGAAMRQDGRGGNDWIGWVIWRVRSGDRAEVGLCCPTSDYLVRWCLPARGQAWRPDIPKTRVRPGKRSTRGILRASLPTRLALGWTRCTPPFRQTRRGCESNGRTTHPARRADLLAPAQHSSVSP